MAIAQILLEEGFIQGYEVTNERPQPNIRCGSSTTKAAADRDRLGASASLAGGCTRASMISLGPERSWDRDRQHTQRCDDR